MQLSAAWLTNTDFHCLATLAEALADKTYPFVFNATMEYGPSTDFPGVTPSDYACEDIGEYAAGNGSISTYMTEDYAQGVSTGEFHVGTQTDAFHLLYRSRAPVARQADMNAVYARYVVNGKKPGQTNVYTAFAAESGEVLLWDEGRKLVLHHERIAMMLYKPKLFGRKGVKSLELALLPAKYGSPEEILAGRPQAGRIDRKGRAAVPCIRQGRLCLYGFHPLLLTNHGRETTVRVSLTNGYVMISSYNYEGPAKDFSATDFQLTGNGFVAEIGNERELGSFAAFRSELKGVCIRDELFSCMHYRWASLRRTAYERGGLTLECEYNPVTEGVKCLAVNGRALRTPELEVTGLDADTLPFLRDDSVTL